MRSNFYYINPIPDRSILSLEKWNQNLTEAGWAEANFLWGAIVKSEKWIFKNSQNLLNKSPKHGGASAPPAPPAPPPLQKIYSGTYNAYIS